MNNTLLFLFVFFTILLIMVVLYYKVYKRPMIIILTTTLLCLPLFGCIFLNSNNFRNVTQESEVENSSSQTNSQAQIENKALESVALWNEKEIESEFFIKESVIIDIPVISQLPELPRGCEVTSLSMLLQHAGVNVGKLELAKKVKRDLTPFQKKDGQVFFGHPNVGFVGDMYNIDNPGYGVYHKPIKELADEYLPNRIVDLTGSMFSKLETSLSNGIPVWIIINSWYTELPPEQFQTWDTPAGGVQITYREHSVLITGYDKDYVYVNDPLTVEKNKKIPKQNFIKAWVQMGSQAITYVNS